MASAGPARACPVGHSAAPCKQVAPAKPEVAAGCCCCWCCWYCQCWMVLDGVGWCWMLLSLDLLHRTPAASPECSAESVTRLCSPRRCSGQKPRATNGSATGRHLISSLDRPPDGCDRGSGRERREREHERERGEAKGLWLLSGRIVADKQVALRHGRHGWLHVPRAWTGGTYSQSSAMVPPACCKSTRRSLGRRMAGRAALYRGHPTDMAPQPYWHIGRLDAAKPCPRRTLLRRLLSAHTYQPSPPSTALPHPPLPLLQLLPIPSTIATVSSLLQLPERRFCARIDAV